MREMKRMVEGVTGGQCGDCVAWLHSADGCSNRPELKCHQPCAEKRPADSLYKHWHFFPPVIECSLKKSTQWIPREFSNAPSQCVYSPMYFTMIEGVSCPWREWKPGGGNSFQMGSLEINGLGLTQPHTSFEHFAADTIAHQRQEFL